MHGHVSSVAQLCHSEFQQIVVPALRAAASILVLRLTDIVSAVNYKFDIACAVAIIFRIPAITPPPREPIIIRTFFSC